MPVNSGVKVPVAGNEGIPKLHIEDYIAQPGLQLSTISYDGQNDDEAGGDLNDILDQLKRMDEYFSNVDVSHVGNKLLDREDLDFLCKPSVACPHVPAFQDIFTNFQVVMPQPKQIPIERDLEQEEAAILDELLKEAAAQLAADDEESVDAGRQGDDDDASMDDPLSGTTKEDEVAVSTIEENRAPEKPLDEVKVCVTTETETAVETETPDTDEVPPAEAPLIHEDVEPAAVIDTPTVCETETPGVCEETTAEAPVEAPVVDQVCEATETPAPTAAAPSEASEAEASTTVAEPPHPPEHTPAAEPEVSTPLKLDEPTQPTQVSYEPEPKQLLDESEPTQLIRESEPAQLPEKSEPAQLPKEPEPKQIPQEPTQSPQEPTGIPQEPTEIPQEPTQLPKEPTQLSEEPPQLLEEPPLLPAEPPQSIKELAPSPKELTQLTEEPTQALTQLPEAPTQAPTQLPEEPTRLPEAPTQLPEEPTRLPEAPTQLPEAPTQAPTQLPEAPTQLPEEPARLPEAPTQFSKEPPQLVETPTRLPEEPLELTEEPTQLSTDPKPAVSLPLPEESPVSKVPAEGAKLPEARDLELEDVLESNRSEGESHMVVRIPVFASESFSSIPNICGSVLPSVQNEYMMSSPRWSASLVGPDGFYQSCTRLPLEINYDVRALWLVGAHFVAHKQVSEVCEMNPNDFRRLAIKMSVVLGGLVERGEASPSAEDRKMEDSTEHSHAYARRHSAPAPSAAVRDWARTLFDIPKPATAKSYMRALRSAKEIREWAENYEADRRWEWNRRRLKTSEFRDSSPSYSPLERVRLRQGEKQARLDRDAYHEETERKFQAQLEAVRARMRQAAAKRSKEVDIERAKSTQQQQQQPTTPVSPPQSPETRKKSAPRHSSLTGTKISVVKPADQLTTPTAPVPPKRHQLPPRTTPNAPTVPATPNEQTTDFRHVLRRTGRLEALRTGRLNQPAPTKDEKATNTPQAVLVHKAMKPSDARDMFERKAREQAKSGEAPSEWFLKQVSKYQKA